MILHQLNNNAGIFFFRYATGEVKGKYGYYDDLGQFREVEYGADPSGFRPSGNGLQLPQVF